MKQFANYLAAVALLGSAFAAQAQPLSIPFDFSRSEIEIIVTVKGQPLHVLLDTGVDPSVISLSRAEALGLKIDRKAQGEADGVGDGPGVAMYAAVIDGLAIQERAFAPVEAGTADLTQLSQRYGSPLDGMLGFSFLRDKIVLIDYPRHLVNLFERAVDVAGSVRTCRKRSRMPMRLLEGQNWPLIPAFRLGAASAPVTLDTGSSGFLTVYPAALELPGVTPALNKVGESSSTGFHGGSKLREYTFNAPTGFGRFLLPAGQTISVRDQKGSADTSLGNAGNKLFAALGVKMLLDYRARTLSFYGDCP